MASASYIPGTKPNEFEKNNTIDLYVSKLDSSLTQLPFDYYYLKFCKPDSTKEYNDNIGQSLTGDLIENSPYKISMKNTVYCNNLCKLTNSKTDIEIFKWMIDNEYKANWVLDGLPSGYRVPVNATKTNLAFYQDGVPIGFKANGKRFLYNHHHFIVKVHQTAENKWRIVGFLVNPMSLNSEERDVCKDYNIQEIIKIQETYTEKIITSEDNFKLVEDVINEKFLQDATSPNVKWSYSVTFEESDTKWASRWDVYLYTEGGEVHWLSILNSFGMVIFLSFMVGHLFRRTLSRDISNYNERVDTDPEVDSGWKQLRGDIFRPPVYLGLFCVCIGSGIQLIFMTLFTIFFACIGFLRPDHRGALLSTMLFLFAFMGCFSGYVSGRFYKMFGGLNWKTNSMGVATIFPGICFMIFFIINLLIWGEESSGAVDFLSLLELICIWFGISVPLVFIGSALGYKKTSIANPCKVSKIPKPIPMRRNYLVYCVCLLAGSLPFGCMFIELNYIMNSLWHHSLFYYLFGFLFLCFIVLIVTSAEVSILMTYIVLCREDYRWWWLSMQISGSSGAYLFLYSGFYYAIKLEISRFTSTVLYFGYMLIGSMAFALITGTIGFISTFVFIRKIFSLIKSD